MWIGMGRLRRLCYGVIVILLVGACASDPTPGLPTRVALEQLVETATADTPAEISPSTPTRTPLRIDRTLPPSWTPAPTATQTPPPPSIVAPTATPFVAPGTLFAIYNGDSIAAINPNTGDTRLIVTFGVGQPISDLALSPDHTLLAYVAPGNGSAREVYVSSLDGTYRQQVSCLGLAEVRAPAWSADGRSLAFLAAALPGEPLDIYTADFAGSGNCPTGNNQRLVLDLNSTRVTEVVWQPDGAALYFNNEAIYAVSLVTGAVSAALTETRGFGVDFGLVFTPMQPNLLTYLQAERIVETDQSGGVAFQIDITGVATGEVNGLLERRALPSSLAQQVEWSADGSALLVSEETAIRLYDMTLLRGEIITSGLAIPPQAILSPEAQFIAYYIPERRLPEVAQLAVLDRASGQTRQITQITEGGFTDLLWAR